MNTDINLIQNKTNKKSQGIDKFILFRILSLIFLFGISFLSVTLFILIALSPLPGLQNQEKDEKLKLSVHHDNMKQVLLTRERIGLIQTFMQNRPLYAEKLSAIESAVPTGVTVSTFKIDEGKVTILTSSSSLEPLDLFATTLVTLNKEKKYFSKITLSSISIVNGAFEMSVQLDKI